MLLNDRYRILEQVGQGGFGSVYKAADTSFGDRLVAIKAMEQKGLSQEEIAEAATSFKREALMLANLRYPHLPRIYDHFSDSGRWYLVMDYIEGETLEVYLQKSVRDPYTGKRHLLVEEVLDIGLQLCAVLDYLHTRQPPIIFRDLKPANVMRTPERHLYLIDFGIARHFKPGQIKDTIPLGSPGYAAPEQYGKVQTTPRADIYSLGVILHQLLTGDDPTNTPFLLAPIQPDGDPILAKVTLLIKQMTEMDESHRPATMAAVKNELQQIKAGQSDQRVLWSLPPAETRSNQFSPRTEGAPASQFQQRQIFVEPKVEERSSRGISRRKLLVGGTALGAALTGLGAWELFAARSSVTPVHGHVFTGGKNYTYTGHKDAVTSVAWSPSGLRIASASDDSTVQVWDAFSGGNVLVYRGQGLEEAVAWSPDGSLIASGSGPVQVWKAATGSQIYTYRGHALIVYGVAWAPDSSRVASASADGTVQVWDATTGGHVYIYRGHTNGVNGVAWSPNGSRIASASTDGTVQVWDATTGVHALTYASSGGAFAVAWSPNGSLIASGNADGTVQVWNATTGDLIYTYRGHYSDVRAVAWSPGGLRLASASSDGTVQVWDATTGSHVYIYRGHSRAVNAVAWAPNGSLIVSASTDGTVQVWKVS
jgi:tRNA A-37 threonylcarbamoyl transferase component Bud32